VGSGEDRGGKKVMFSHVGRVGLIVPAGFSLFFILADVVMIEKILNELSLQKFWHH
jgi:hypothetical protein